jgi:hypothetical protein
VQGQALRARDPRASLTAARHVGRQSMRPGRKDGSAEAEQMDGTKARKLHFPVLISH